MALFFDGRLHETPAVVSKVDDSAMRNRGLSVGNNLALLGKSAGGEPATVLRFGSPEQARATLVSGELLDAVLRAFDPSAETGGPAEVVAVRVDPAVQSTLLLKDGTAATVITLTSTGYGARENQIKVKIEAATTKGLKVTTQRVNDYYAQDNIFRDAFKIRYTGVAASAVMSISATQAILQAPSGTTVATIAFADFPTVQETVDRINAVTGFAGTVLDGNGTKPTLNGLDVVTSQDVKTADYTAAANLQAVVDWFNSAGEGLVGAERASEVGTVPAAIPFTYLSGGTNGAVTNTEWTAGFSVLQTADVQWVVPVSSDPAIHAMADGHVAYMSTVGSMERRAICGTPLATSDAAAIALAKAINSDRTSLVHLGGYDFDLAGALVLYPPYIVAAMIAGAFCGTDPGEPMTNKSLKLRGLERKLRKPTDTDALIRGGVIAIEDAPTGYRVVKSVSTWLNNTNYYRVEQSVGVALDYTARAVRNALEVLKGVKGTPQALSQAASLTETTLRALAVPAPNGPGVLAGDPAGGPNPAYKNIQAVLDGDKISVGFQCSPVIPVNYVPVTIYAVPYSGSVSI